jgi:hypothetical protein
MWQVKIIGYAPSEIIKKDARIINHHWADCKPKLYLRNILDMWRRHEVNAFSSQL